MVKITNGIDIFEVTRGAFDEIYRYQGYTIIDKEREPASVHVEPVEPEMSEDEKFIREISEKPISMWNKEEIKKYAQINDIDISGTKNAGEAKDIIKEFMEKEDNE